jgi:thioredoxin 1
MGYVVRLTDVNFEDEALIADVPVLIEFWASWCPPCKMAEPVIEELAVEYDGRLKVGKINVDQNPRMRNRYGVQGVPTFVVLVAGEEKDRRVGAQSRSQLQKLLEAAHVLPAPVGEIHSSAAQSEETEDWNKDEEKIRERLRALGYIE